MLKNNQTIKALTFKNWHTFCMIKMVKWNPLRKGGS